MRREMESAATAASAAADAKADAKADVAASERRGEAVAATEKRAALERRRKDKLADRKRADAQAARAQKAQAPPAAADEETWRVDRNLAAQADRGARLALRAGQLEEAKELALQAVALFESAGKQGFRKAPPSCAPPLPPLFLLLLPRPRLFGPHRQAHCPSASLTLEPLARTRAGGH